MQKKHFWIIPRRPTYFNVRDKNTFYATVNFNVLTENLEVFTKRSTTDWKNINKQIITETEIWVFGNIVFLVVTGIYRALRDHTQERHTWKTLKISAFVCWPQTPFLTTINMSEDRLKW